MADFRIWGCIEHIASHRFFVIVTAIREDDPADAAPVTRTVGSREAAEQLRRELMIEKDAAVRAGGGRVIDAEAN